MIEFITKLLPYISPAIYFLDNYYWPWQARRWKTFIAWPFLVVFTLIVAALDVLLAHTLWAYHFGFPRRGEWTISHTLERLCRTGFHPKISLFIALARKINRISVKHIKAVL